MKNLVVLDGHTLNPGDLSWTKLEILGNTVIYDRTEINEIYERAKEAEILLTNKVPLNSNMLSKLSHLEYIGVLATGVNIVDVKAAAERGVIVTNIPAYGSKSVAQHAFALILDLIEDLAGHMDNVKQGGWSGQPDFSYTIRTTYELAGKTLGVVGFGKIAREVIKIGQAFEMKIWVNTRRQERQELMKNVEFVTREQLFEEADIVTLHTSLRPDNEMMVNRHILSLMKPNSFLVNTSRGGLINETDLADFLNKGFIAGAALDVLSQEPPSPDNPLLAAQNCLITPHMAWATIEARQRLLDIAIDNIKAFLGGSPVNVVS